jgi:asparagine synthase (glutamine-hydrolysing)
LLKASVGDHLQSDVEVAAYVSGGIDSSTVASIAAAERPSRLRCFVGRYSATEGIDEGELAGYVIDRIRGDRFDVFPQSDELAAYMGRLIWHLDEPIAGPGAFSQYIMARAVARSGVKVVLGGQGGDELFAGYPPFLRAAARDLLARTARAPLSWDTWRAIAQQRVLPLLTQIALTRATSRLSRPYRLAPAARQRIGIAEQLAAESAREGLTGAWQELVWLNLRYGLPSLLHVEDRVSMAWGVESRVPLLDDRLIQWALTTSSESLLRGGRLKSLLREAAKPFLPDSVLLSKRKLGFPTPIASWFRGPLKPFLTDSLLSQSRLADLPAMGDQIRSVMAHFHTTGRGEDQLWRLLSTEHWLRAFFP